MTTKRSTTAAATNLVVSTNPAKLLKVIGYNAGAAQFLQIHNKASLPADTTVPDLSIAIAATSNFDIDFGDYGFDCNVGIVVCNSSTVATKTIGSANLFITALVTAIDGQRLA